MTIGPVAAVAMPITPMVTPSMGTAATGSADAATGAAGATGAGGFGNALSSGLDNLQQLQNTADTYALQAADGTLTNVHDYMIAATKASVATDLTVAVRNKALESFQQIMQMQV
ncbi:MAG TPA: flagellar hook-basal body complex protein FliE [Dermatophilaceae bacterium]